MKTYWNDSALASNGFASAKSYIPEVPWNDSCASEIMAKFYTGSTLTYGTSGFCNNTFATTGNEFLSTGSGSGGPSGLRDGIDGGCQFRRRQRELRRLGEADLPVEPYRRSGGSDERRCA